MELIMLSVKDLVQLLWNVFLSFVLLWLISNLFMAIIKTLFCDIQLKSYRTMCKRLKKYSDVELEKVLRDIEIKKKI